MIPVDQRGEGATGTCWRACLASLLEVELDRIPAALDCSDESRNQALDTGLWLRTLGCDLLAVPRGHGGWPPKGLCILTGPSPRFEGQEHAVVGRLDDDRILRQVHDPHPSRAGLERTKVEWYYYIIPVEFSPEGYRRAADLIEAFQRGEDS